MENRDVSVMSTSAYPPLFAASAYHERAMVASLFARFSRLVTPPLIQVHGVGSLLWPLDISAVSMLQFPRNIVGGALRRPPYRVCERKLLFVKGTCCPWEAPVDAFWVVVASVGRDQERHGRPQLGPTCAAWQVRLPWLLPLSLVHVNLFFLENTYRK